MKPRTTSGASPNASGITLESSASARMSHLESRPINRDALTHLTGSFRPVDAPRHDADVHRSSFGQFGRGTIHNALTVLYLLFELFSTGPRAVGKRAVVPRPRALINSGVRMALHRPVH